jgi:dihydroxyacid dehydratase/phosphogluconate dehydratase
MAPAPGPRCVACDDTATQVHQRHATPAELERFIADPSNPSVQAGETDAMIAVYTCDDHSPARDVAGLIHQSYCVPPCTCVPDEPIEQPPLVDAWE